MLTVTVMVIPPHPVQLNLERTATILTPLCILLPLKMLLTIWIRIVTHWSFVISMLTRTGSDGLTDL